MVLACVLLVEVDGATCSRFPVRYYCTDRLSVSAKIIFPDRHSLLATMRYDFFHKASTSGTEIPICENIPG